MRSALLLLVAAAAASPLRAQASSDRDCGIQSGARLENNGVGAVRIGATVDQLASQCQIVREIGRAHV